MTLLAGRVGKAFRFGRAVSGLALLGALGVVLAFHALAPESRANPRGELAPLSSGAVTIVALSDVHGRPGVLSQAFDSARTLGADAVLIGGDLVNANFELEYRYGGLLLAQAPPVPVFLAIGNHEGFDRHGHLSRERFERFFGPPVSWFAIKGVLVVSIDTSDEHSFPEDEARAADVILTAERPRARHAVLLTHVLPRFERPLIDKRGFVKHLDVPDSERLRALCEKHRVELVLGGHFHGYASERRGDTLFVVSGGGGGALEGPGEFYHYLRLRFDGSGVTSEVVRVESPRGPAWLLYLFLRNLALVLGAPLGAVFVTTAAVRCAAARVAKGATS